MTFLTHASTISHKSADVANAARRKATEIMRAAQPKIFDAILFFMNLPRNIRNAFKGHAARKAALAAAHTPVYTAAAATVPTVTAPANDSGAPQFSPQPNPQQPVIITREARGIIALSRENPKLAILIVVMVMGAIQMGLFALIILMLHDSGYSSGWGDATKYFFQCQSRQVL